jgi:adenosine/AMP kinase
MEKDVDNFNSKIGEIIQSNVLFAAKTLQEFAKVFAATGNTYSAVISAGLEVGISLKI